MTYYDIMCSTIASIEYDHSLLYMDKAKHPFVSLFPLAFANVDFFQKENSFIGREV